jgi:hypothetical protein
MSDRDTDLQHINSLYGIPGTYESEIGRRFVIETIEELGDAALTDEAIALLARKNRAEDDRMGRAAEASFNRNQRR